MSLKKQYNIGDVYLFGFSQGAIFAYVAGIKIHNLYKGLIIHSGPGLLEPLISPFTGEKNDNWLGKDDKKVKYELGIKSKDILSNFGYDVTFRDFTGGHSVNHKMLESVN